MDLLEWIRAAGLPEWLFVSLVLVIIAKMIGFLDPLIAFFAGISGMVRERVEASVATERTEQIATWQQLTGLIKTTLDREERLLEYIISDNRQELADIRNEIKSNYEKIEYEIKQERAHVRTIEGKLTLMIQIMSKWYDQGIKADPNQTIHLKQAASSEERYEQETIPNG